MTDILRTQWCFLSLDYLEIHIHFHKWIIIQAVGSQEKHQSCFEPADSLQGIIKNSFFVLFCFSEKMQDKRRATRKTRIWNVYKSLTTWQEMAKRYRKADKWRLWPQREIEHSWVHPMKTGCKIVFSKLSRLSVGGKTFKERKTIRKKAVRE